MLALRNQGTRTFDTIAAADVRDFPALRREITNVLELGYRGATANGTTFAVDVHATRLHDRLLGTAVAGTPNVFFDRATLEQYVAGFRDTKTAAQIAAALAQIPVGIVTPIESPYPTDILLLGRQGQTYTLWGIDLTGVVPLGSRVSVTSTYSLASYDTVSTSGPDIPVNLNIPRQKASVEATYRDAAATLLGSVRFRAVGPFRRRGLFRDPAVPGYGVVDVAATYRIPPARRFSIAAEVRNVFDNPHREHSGSPEIRRLGVVRTRVEF